MPLRQCLKDGQGIKRNRRQRITLTLSQAPPHVTDKHLSRAAEGNAFPVPSISLLHDPLKVILAVDDANLVANPDNNGIGSIGLTMAIERRLEAPLSRVCLTGE